MVTEFESWGVTVIAQDPWADPDEILSKYGVELADTVEPGSLDAVVVAVGHREFRLLQPVDLQNLCWDVSRAVLGDLKSLYDRHACSEAGFDVFRFDE